MSVATSTAQPVYLSTHVFEQDIPPSIADGIAELLKLDRQIIIVTGKADGRMLGFLADLTHGISRRGSLLRLKSSLGPEELHGALAAQLHLPIAQDNAVQTASRVGHRLQQPAPRGRFVLLCEAVDQYPLATLEAIRQISNYPVSIVLVGGHALNRRLRRASLRPLRQRVTHQLSLNRMGMGMGMGLWGSLAIAALLLAAGVFWWHGNGVQEAVSVPAAAAQSPTLATESVAEPLPLPIRAAPSVAELQPVQETQAEPVLRLTLERELSHPPAHP